MPLTKFKLVNTGGLKGLFYKGDFVPFEKINDELAEELLGKTHVLERVEQPVTPAPAVVAEIAAEAEEAPAATGKRPRSN